MTQVFIHASLRVSNISKVWLSCVIPAQETLERRVWSPEWSHFLYCEHNDSWLTLRCVFVSRNGKDHPSNIRTMEEEQVVQPLQRHQEEPLPSLQCQQHHWQACVSNPSGFSHPQTQCWPFEARSFSTGQIITLLDKIPYKLWTCMIFHNMHAIIEYLLLTNIVM